ncbi:MAG: radical SAM family heme chaperone HemW [Gallionella sp.]|nr:radical SAM family heme chaperone HemW [Gallionella sp.]
MTLHPLQPVALSAPRIAFRAVLPLSLYIHIPWCVRKCPYCDFNSHEARAPIPEQAYIAALVRDLELALPQIWGRKIRSVFFGGGTPSLFSGTGIVEIMRQLRTLLPLIHDAEITLEANPGTVEAERFAAYRDAGINRLSLGIQSFNDNHLQALGRIHSSDDAHRAIATAQEYFDNFNLDLMYGLPQQTLADAVRDVETALSFAPPHLSCYQLTLEPNTRFHREPPVLPDEDISSDMQQHIEARLAAQGFEHYETSAFARPGKRSRHNLNYWEFGDYLGIGAGAHSKLSFPDRVERQMRHKQPQAYLAAIERGEPRQTFQAVSAAELPFEFMMNALRLNQGFDPALFELRTSLSLLAIRRELAQAEARGLLRREIDRIAPTQLGQRFLNELLQIFLAPEHQIPDTVPEA